MTVSSVRQGVRFTKIGFSTGVSVAALLLGSSQAYAQCAPDPTVANGTTTCAGVDPDGVRVVTPGTTIVVSAGADVRGSASPAIVIDTPTTGPVVETVNVQGAVTGNGQPGILLLSARTGFSLVQLNVNVASGASVSGSNAVSIGRNPASTGFSNALVTIDNAGTLSGTSGIALAIGPINGGYQSITNRSTGSIGAIAAPLGTLANAGTINGGSNSAINTSGTSAGATTALWTNTGLITSASTGGTIANMAQNTPGISNSGVISNTGGGPAFSGSFVYLNNLAGGVVSTTGPNAIVADLGLTLTNAGRIDGNVVVNTPSGFGFSTTIDSTAGTINGNVMLGNANDTLVARYTGTPTLVTGITGSINAGAGINSVRLLVGSDTTFNTAIALPATFQQLQLALAKDATATLADGFVAPGTIALIGLGSVVNRTTVSGTGALFVADVNTGPLASFSNFGTLTTSGSNALGLTQVGTVLNAGTISAGNGIAVGLSVGGPFTNSGTITATDRAVAAFATPIDNSGVIRSTGATGVVISGSTGLVLTNSGRIEGALDGVASNVLVSNSGIITGTRNGVLLDAYGTLFNAAGGSVTGVQSVSGQLFFAGVANAGNLNGDVVLAGSDNRFLALTGGILNGNLSLGSRGILVTDLVNAGPGQFAGITGTVSVTDGTLRYRVNSDATATLGSAGPFRFAGYEIGSGATLTLTAPTTVIDQVVLAGTGAVVLNADLSATNAAAVVTTSPIDLSISAPATPTALSITNRGTITLNRPAGNAGTVSAVALSFGDTFTNAGTITVVDRNANSTSYAIGASNTAKVVNNGTIRLDGGIGVFGASSLVNTGSIVQVSGGAVASGVLNVASVDNRGTISTAGAAVTLNGGTLLNSGSLASTGGVAVLDAGSGATISNLAGGSISAGSGFAVRVQGARLTNAGTISGSVDLGFLGASRSSARSVYTAAGGSITGDLVFGSGDDSLVVNSGSLGVSGIVDGGAGIDAVVLDRPGVGTLGGVTNFESLAVNTGTWTVTAPSSFANGTTIAANAGLVGTSATLSGAIVNGGALTFDQSSAGTFTGAITGAGVVTKAGTGTLTLGAQAYTGATVIQSGTLALTGNLAGGSYTVASGAALTSSLAATISTTATTVAITNSGTISTTNATGRAINLAGSANARTITLTNNAGAVITSADDAFRINFAPTGGTITVNNAGVIRTTASGQALDFDAVAGGATIVINNLAGGELRSFGQDAIRPGQGAVVTNAGLIMSDGAPNNSFDGVDWQARSGTVVNQAGGTISGLRHGITSDTAVNVTNAGTILGRNGSGVGSDGTGTVTNTGTITGQWDGVATNGDGDGVDIDLIGSVTNSGIIQGLSAAGVDSGGRPNSAEGIAIGGGTIVNNAGALVFGAGNAVLANHDTNPGGVADGATTITNAGTIRAGSGRAIQFVGAFADTITNSGTITGGAAGAIDMGDGANLLTNATGGTITGTVIAGSGDDTFTNAGTVNGNVNLGNGNNTFIVQSGGVLNGTVTVGAGIDLLAIQTNGTDQSPTQIVGSNFIGFETLQNTAGTTRLAGSFTGAVNVVGGKLFGAQGSTITGNVGVGTGAQFGTSGIVNGNVAVAAGATLAPGSSPGVMTVNGNVALAAGASSTFEFVPPPGQSDQLLISGQLTIGANTTLNLTGTRPLTPGVNYDLIVANGGITGSFATINQSATIGGFIRYTSTRLQLMGTFLTPAGLTVQQAAAVNYVNNVLIAGQGSAALFTAVPQLLDAGGATNVAAFNLLTAEAYASASQLGVENGLTLAQAGRSGLVRTNREQPGLFAFAQGMGGRRTLNANATNGTARARIESSGVLGGIGFGTGNASIGAFVGRLDSEQRIAALGAKTEGDGVVAGVAGHFAYAGLELSLLGAYDWTKVVTSRTVPGATVSSSRYRLRNTTFDASLGANIPISAELAVRPEAGITHIRGYRSSARETGSAAFALDIDGRRYNATFIDASVALKGGLNDGAKLHPWLKAGVRDQIEGGIELASAGFVGTTSRFVAFGAARKETMVTAGAGLDYDIKGVTLFAAYQGEFGGGNGHFGNVGVRFAF